MILKEISNFVAMNREKFEVMKFQLLEYLNRVQTGKSSNLITKEQLESTIQRFSVLLFFRERFPELKYYEDILVCNTNKGRFPVQATRIYLNDGKLSFWRGEAPKTRDQKSYNRVSWRVGANKSFPLSIFKRNKTVFLFVEEVLYGLKQIEILEERGLK